MKWLAWFGLCFAAAGLQAETLPRPDHVVIVVEENKSFAQIIGNPGAPYINALAQRGVLFTQSYGVTHPSQPNYLALFSGSTHGIGSNVCPLALSGDNLASALLAQGLSFASFSESMPEAGYDGCMYGAYMRKHNPVANWPALSRLNLSFEAFPQDFSMLPTVALVMPDQRHNMHDGSIAQGDAWLARYLDTYVRWAMTHHSLLIVTWDEDNGTAGNRIATLMVGPMVKPGQSAQRIDHYRVLRTLSDMYGFSPPGESAHALPITGVWQAYGRNR